ncbi:MAG: thermonuclease family protein [Gemmatimonadales bacterium]
MRTSLLVLIAFALFGVRARAQEPDEPPTCKVSRIIDGDTLECRLGGVKQSVRLIGIGAPETRQRPYGPRATAALKRLVRIGSEVILDLDVQERDSRGRLLAYVWTDDAVMVNEAMLSRGYAVLYSVPPNVKYIDDLRAAATEAQKRRRGLWATEAFTCTPADFRQGKCRA